MSARKVVPTLRSWVEDDGKWSTQMHLAAGEAQRIAQAELRDLLAVARAAEPFEGRGCDCHPDSPASRLRRAIINLRRRSGGKGRGR